MSAQRYRNFLKLLEKWPVDPSKSEGNRDLGQHIRENVSKAFSKGEMSRLTDDSTCDEEYEALKRIATDFHRHKYLVKEYGTACQISLDNLKLINSTEGLKVLQEPPSFLERVRLFRK